jgi:TrmH family RNA methyltransferase
MKPLSNTLAKKIKSLHTQKAREEQSLFLIEGQKCLHEAIKYNIEIEQVVCSNSFCKTNNLPSGISTQEIFTTNDKQLEQLATTDTSCEIIAVAKIPTNSIQAIFESNHTPFIVIAESIQDPGNIGTIIRTALATSATGIVLTKGCASLYNPKVVRSAMGTLFGLPIAFDIEIETLLDLLKKQNIKIIAADASAKTPYNKANLKGASAFIFGSEGQGLSKLAISSAHEKISIPMNENVESLNVAISAGIILYEAYQQRLSEKK